MAENTPVPTAENYGLRFEELVERAASRLMSASFEGLDAEIARVLRESGEFLNGDRAYLFALDPDGDRHRVAYLWTGNELPKDPVVVGTVIQDGFPWLGRKMLAHQEVVIGSVDDLPAEASVERSYCMQIGIQSFLMCPMYCGDQVVGMIGIDFIRGKHSWSDEDIRWVRLRGALLAGALVRRRNEDEINALKEKLEAENAYLRTEFVSKDQQAEIVGESRCIVELLREVEQVAPTDSNVLILGETGTGKELVARTLHRLSPRSDKTAVFVNCAALSPALVESELFGREKGAYTGAHGKQIGRFELADNSTLFLDEVGELSLETQAKLLRVLENGEFERLGSPKTHKVDVRLIAATNRDLKQAVADGKFREDLYYRLNVFPITVPPLRERRSDIPILVWAFVQEFEAHVGHRIEKISEHIMERLKRYDWPGNVRELRNVIERGMILSQGKQLKVDLPGLAADAGGGNKTLAEFERDHIETVLVRVGWRVRGKGGAAQILGLKPSTLESRMKKHGIRRPGGG